MNYVEIKYCDIANGPGCRVSLFVSGCNNKCPGCFNQVAWDFNYGKKFTKIAKDDILKLCEPYWIQGLSILGGEPLDPRNINEVAELTSLFKEKYPKKDIWLYTGYTMEQILTMRSNFDYRIATSQLFENVDILVDGPFIEEKKGITLKFRGSSNQRIIDISRSDLNHWKYVVWKDHDKEIG